jgi:hypothetical protein
VGTGWNVREPRMGVKRGWFAFEAQVPGWQQFGSSREPVGREIGHKSTELDTAPGGDESGTRFPVGRRVPQIPVGRDRQGRFDPIQARNAQEIQGLLGQAGSRLFGLRPTTRIVLVRRRECESNP